MTLSDYRAATERLQKIRDDIYAIRFRRFLQEGYSKDWARWQLERERNMSDWLRGGHVILH